TARPIWSSSWPVTSIPCWCEPPARPNETRRSASSLSRLQQQLLHPPVGGLGRIDLVLRRTGELMSAREFLEIAAGLADHAQHLAFKRDFEDAAREGRLADEHHLVLPGRDADRVGRSDHSREPLASRRVAVGRACRRIGRNIDREHAQELALS